MITYKPAKGTGIYYILGTMLVYNAIIILAVLFVRTYILVSLLKIFLLLFNIYQLYYIVLVLSLKYGVDNENIYILSFLRKYKISFNEVEGYKVNSGKINGIRLSGFGTNFFALGKSIIKEIGTSSMFATSNKNIVYLKLKDKCFAVSPMDYIDFLRKLKEIGIIEKDWQYKRNKDVSLHKDKSFMIPFLIATIIIVVLTINPFILYLMNALPNKIPLNFDASFMPVEYGTGKQFAFSQMIYGVLNMAIEFCMYYASHFYARYDRKSAKKFIYASLVIAAVFLTVQIRILNTFR